MTTATAPKLRQGTHLGVPTLTGTTRIVHARRAYNLHEIHWLAKATGQPVEYEAGTIVFRVCTGDFMRGTGVVHETVVITPEDSPNMISLSRQLLADRITQGRYAR